MEQKLDYFGKLALQSVGAGVLIRSGVMLASGEPVYLAVAAAIAGVIMIRWFP